LVNIPRSLGGVAALLALLGAPCAQAQDNPLARQPVAPAQLANGRWNGVDLERRSGCVNTQNEGSRGTYAQFDVNTNLIGDFTILQTGITGLTCNYVGRYSSSDGLEVDGTYSCTDGKQGKFRTSHVDVQGGAMTLQMDVQLSGSETCAIKAVIGMARFYP
jgi:hypothetical protein